VTVGRAPAVQALVGGAAALALLTGCGGQSDNDQIAAIVKQEGTNPASVCDHLAGPLLSRMGGKAGCLREAGSSVRDPTTRATAIRVQGRTATAVVLDSAGSQTITLLKQNGSWKVAAVR
jgi:hypothetical protein